MKFTHLFYGAMNALTDINEILDEGRKCYNRGGECHRVHHPSRTMVAAGRMEMIEDQVKHSFPKFPSLWELATPAK
jgi:hypothetical protein